MTDALLALAWAQLWQVTLLVVVLAALIRVLCRNRPHLAYALWLVVLVKCITPPVFTSTSGVFCWLQPAEHVAANEHATTPQSVPLTTTAEELVIPLYPVDDTVTASPTVAATAEATPFRFTSPDWARFALLAWMIGASVSFFLSLWRWRACLRAAKQDRRHPAQELEERVSQLARRLGMRRRVRVFVTQGRLGPAVTSIIRPTLLMPEGILTSKSLDEQEPLLAHELIHIRRGDLWAGLLQTIVQALWWFHPLVLWAVRESMREAERCCDEAVLAELGCRPKDYARCLLGVLQYKMEWAPAPVFPGVRRIDVTAKRLERIMRLRQGCRRRSPWWCSLVMLGAAAVVLPGGAFVVSADDERPPEDGPSPQMGSVRDQELSAAEEERRPAPDEGDSTYLVQVYAIDDLVEGFAESAGGDLALGKRRLLQHLGFDFEGGGVLDGHRRAAWDDKRLVVHATQRQHKEIKDELEVLGNHGLAPLQVEVVCITGEPQAVKAIASGLDVPDVPIDPSERPDLADKWQAVQVNDSMEDVLRRVRSSKGIEVTASPKMLLASGQRGSIRIGSDIPYRVDESDSEKDTRYIFEGFEVKLTPYVRRHNSLWLHFHASTSHLKDATPSADEPREPQIVKVEAETETYGSLEKIFAIQSLSQSSKGSVGERMLCLVRASKIGQSAPRDNPNAVQRAWQLLGFEAEPIDRDEFQRDFNTRYRGGLRITKIRPDSPASAQGLRLGDVLVGLHIWETTSLKNLDYVLNRRDLEEFTPIKFYLLRDGDILYGHFAITGLRSSKQEGRLKPGEDVYIVTYDVADLVAPISNAASDSDSPAIASDSTPPKGRLAPAPRPSGYGVADTDSSKSEYDSLIELIQTTVAPDSWEDAGGQGTIAAFEANRSLVIRQTEGVHKEIIGILEQIRRMQKLQIVLRTRVVAMSEDSSPEFLAQLSKETPSMVVDAATAKRFLAQAGEGVQEAAAVTLINGQSVQIPLGHASRQSTLEERLAVQAVVSDDHREVQLTAQTVRTPLHHASLQLASGDSAVLEVTECVDAAEPGYRSYVLVTALVVEEEARVGEREHRDEMR